MLNEHDKNGMEIPDNSNTEMDNNTAAGSHSGGALSSQKGETRQTSIPYGAAEGARWMSQDPYGASSGAGAANQDPYGAAGGTGVARQPAVQSEPLQREQPGNSYGWQQRIPQPVHTLREPVKRVPKEGTSLGKRIAGITAAALLFGTVSGGTMVGINVAAGRYVQGASQAGVSESAAEPAPVAEAQAEAAAPVAAPQVSTALAMDVSDIVEMAMPSVVAINNTMVYESQNWFGQRQTYEVPGSGSGIIVGKSDEELLIVTNNHVVEGAKALNVTFIDNASVEAAVKGTDPGTDLAVIAVPLSAIEAETMGQIKVAARGDSDSLKVGQGVIAIGNALGYGQSVTVGYVSAIDREVQTEDRSTRNLLQTDAAINPGNSGGALLNLKGELIGINAAKYTSTEVEGMGYAIPISKANDIIDELMTRKARVEVAKDKQGYLGIQGQNIDEATAKMYDMPTGIYVYKIVEDGAAAASDLREKDIITRFDGQAINTMADLKSMLTYYEGGSTVTLTVQSLENGQYVERSVDITLGTVSQSQVN